MNYRTVSQRAADAMQTRAPMQATSTARAQVATGYAVVQQGMPPSVWADEANAARAEELRRQGVIRVVLAESLALYGGALVALLSYERDIQVVAAVRSDGDAVAAVTRTRADVAIIDVDMSGRDGFALSRRLHEAAPQCKVLVLTSSVTPGTLRRALEAHAQGLVDKDAPASWLSESIRRVAGGERVVDPKLAIAALESDTHNLTQRELEVLRRAAQGESVREIASRLCLSDGTVRNYLSKIIGKLGARNRIDAIRIVRDSGWL
ncbi:DNA-binding response regulator [Sporichthya sp.]|uniref:response regulator transcription factor n=1 Tax=Sporichthya sp. TaxID=65475 RepID=UPI0025E34260|nr:response regulator transcription factor [Sporichthya sp.]